MKAIVSVIAASVLVAAFSLPVQAATKSSGMKSKEASCQAQAKKKYSAVHFLKRRAYVKRCMGEA